MNRPVQENNTVTVDLFESKRQNCLAYGSVQIMVDGCKFAIRFEVRPSTTQTEGKNPWMLSFPGYTSKPAEGQEKGKWVSTASPVNSEGRAVVENAVRAFLDTKKTTQKSSRVEDKSNWATTDSPPF